MKFEKRMLADLLVVLGLAGFVVWYLLEAWGASGKTENLILILPISVITLVLCALELFQQLRQGVTQEHQNREAVSSVLPVMALFAGYVIALEWLGFDLATVIFVAAFLALQGERRAPWLVGYSVCFGMLVALFFSNMLPYPMPMSLLPTDY